MRKLIAFFILALCACSQKSDPVLSDKDRLEIRELQLQIERIRPQWVQLNSALEEKVKRVTPGGYALEDGPQGLRFRRQESKPKK